MKFLLIALKSKQHQKNFVEQSFFDEIDEITYAKYFPSWF